jgi:hypothetical protein
MKTVVHKPLVNMHCVILERVHENIRNVPPETKHNYSGIFVSFVRNFDKEIPIDFPNFGPIRIFIGWKEKFFTVKSLAARFG